MEVKNTKVADESSDNASKIGDELLGSLRKADIELLVTMLNNVNIRGDMAEQIVRMKTSLNKIVPLFPAD